MNIIKDKRRSYMENLLMTTNRAPLLTHGQTGIRNRLVFFFRGVQECFQSVFVMSDLILFRLGEELPKKKQLL